MLLEIFPTFAYVGRHPPGLAEQKDFFKRCEPTGDGIFNVDFDY